MLSENTSNGLRLLQASSQQMMKRIVAVTIITVFTLTSWIFPCSGALAAIYPSTSTTTATTQSQQPNILVIFGDDIGWFNTSAYNRGMMGYQTPNIDRIAEEGIMFTDYYGENSCTASRAAFVTGQSPFRTGLLKVGLPGADLGLRPEDPTIKVHLDGYNFLPYLTGKTDNGPRKDFFYFTDDGDLSALRYKDWKVMFLEQRGEGFDVWQEPLVPLRFPRLINLRRDPFERAATESQFIGYGNWRAHRMFALVPAQAVVKEFLATFEQFPPRQKSASFGIDQVLEKLEQRSIKD